MLLDGFYLFEGLGINSHCGITVAGAFRLEVLRAEHDRKVFSCGVQPLDRYFREQATQDIRRRVSACYVAIHEATFAIAGYYTLAASGVPLAEMPSQLAKRLPPLCFGSRSTNGPPSCRSTLPSKKNSGPPYFGTRCCVRRDPRSLHLPLLWTPKMTLPQISIIRGARLRATALATSACKCD